MTHAGLIFLFGCGLCYVASPDRVGIVSTILMGLTGVMLIVIGML